MFSEVELRRTVKFLAQQLEKDGLITGRSVVTRLLEDLSGEKSSRDHGYYMTVTKLKRIGRGVVIDCLGRDYVFFPVVFNCRTFMPVKGDVLQGVVYHVTSIGVFVRCGPIKCAYLSNTKMPDYRFIPGENPVFLNGDLSRIEKNVVVRFSVLDVRWIGNDGPLRRVRWIENDSSLRRDFIMLATIEGDSLGPVSLSGSDELEL